MSLGELIVSRPKFQVVVGFPHGGGPCMGPATAHALYRATQHHNGALVTASGSWCNFNRCLAIALTMATQGKCTHFAMLHSDVSPQEFWVDTLIEECERLNADMVSVVIPIKDPRGVTTSGIGNPANRWHPLKRFTMAEVYKLPETFNAEDAGFAGLPLLHSHGCFLADLRKPLWFTMRGEELALAWDFTQRIVKSDAGEYGVEGESEDWQWSRVLHDLGAKTYITRKVRLNHEGSFSFPNTGPWGVYDEGDKDTEETWKPLQQATTPTVVKAIAAA
jgi:hypothetical protein